MVRGGVITSDEKLEDTMSEQLTSTCDKLVNLQDYILLFDGTV